MENYKFSFKQSFLRSSIRTIELLTAFLLIFMIVFLLTCAGKKMSVEEAKKVTIAMSEESFVPPPRRIDDILAVLDQTGQVDPAAAAKLKAQADALPPDTEDPITLAMFYKKRGLMAFELGRPQQALEDLRMALGYAEKKEGEKVSGLNIIDYSWIITNLALAEGLFGNYSRQHHRQPGSSIEMDILQRGYR